MCATSCQKELSSATKTNTQLRISFLNKVDTGNLQLGSTYQNPFGEDLTISMFKYYVSNFRLRKADNSWTNVNDIYHLVDEADTASKTFMITLPIGEYTAISFYIGVDSTRNVSGTQSGDLDPLKGMFWTWNSGYVMAKIEATSTFSSAPNNNVSIHVGGFKTGENTVRQVAPGFPAGDVINLSPNKTSELVMSANLNTWFRGGHDLKVADNPVCTNAGELAVKFADNYTSMFKVVSIVN